MIGKSEDENYEKILRKENNLFGDILQSDVSDSYRSLPEKVKYYLYKRTKLVYLKRR